MDAALDFETFLIYVRIFMDDIAKCTQAFFPRLNLPASFDDLRKWPRMKDKDPDYARFLATETTWFDDLRALRVEIEHFGLRLVPCDAEHGDIRAWKMGPKQRGRSVQSLRLGEHTKQIMRSLIKFMKQDEDHLRRRARSLAGKDARRIRAESPFSMTGKHAQALRWALHEDT
jgi:pyoverdine/dityrosine biosynthesis protein Dit1